MSKKMMRLRTATVMAIVVVVVVTILSRRGNFRSASGGCRTRATVNGSQAAGIFYSEQSAKISAGSIDTERWLVGEHEPTTERVLEWLHVPHNIRRRGLISNLRELIVGMRRTRATKVYQTTNRGDIHALEWNEEAHVRKHLYLQRSAIILADWLDSPLAHRFARLLNGRFGHVRVDDANRVNAVYVSVLGDRLPVSFFKSHIANVMQRPLHDSEVLWWNLHKHHIVSFVGVGHGHITLYFNLLRYSSWPVDDIKKMWLHST